jgi:hypothetical protein
MMPPSKLPFYWTKLLQKSSIDEVTIASNKRGSNQTKVRVMKKRTRQTTGKTKGRSKVESQFLNLFAKIRNWNGRAVYSLRFAPILGKF